MGINKNPAASKVSLLQLLSCTKEACRENKTRNCNLLVPESFAVIVLG